MWPIRGSLYAKGFLIVLLGSEGQCSRKALAEEESERLLFFLCVENTCFPGILLRLVSSAPPIISALC